MRRPFAVRTHIISADRSINPLNRRGSADCYFSAARSARDSPRAVTGPPLFLQECPFPCVCFANLGEDRSTLTVDCRGQELQQLPYPIPNSTSHL